MNKTVVFLPSDYPNAVTQKMYKNSDKIMGSILQLETILKKINVSVEGYLSAVAWLKTKAGQPAILLQRKPSECQINNYNIHLLRP